MLEVKENQSGHTIEVTFKGTNAEVSKALASFVNNYCNGGYGGRIESFSRGDIAKFEGGIYTAVCTRDSNCD